MASAVQRAFVLSGQHGMPPVVSLPEAESQSFKRGALVKLVADSGEADAGRGKVTIVSANATDKIYGMALQDASGTEDTMLLIQPLTQNVRFVMSVNGTSSSYFQGNYSEIETSGNYFCIDSDKQGSAGDATKQSVIVHDTWNDPWATAYGRVICTVRGSFSGYEAGIE